MSKESGTKISITMIDAGKRKKWYITKSTRQSLNGYIPAEVSIVSSKSSHGIERVYSDLNMSHVTFTFEVWTRVKCHCTLHRLIDSLVVECWLRVREVPGSIPSQGPRHTKDVIKMVPVVPLFGTQH